MPQQNEGRYKCPHCNELTDELDYNCNYSEMTYGVERGSYDIADEGWNEHNSECQDYGDKDNDDYQYECPHCHHDVSIEDMIDTEDEDYDDEEEDEIEEIKPETKKGKTEEEYTPQILFNSNLFANENTISRSMAGYHVYTENEVLFRCEGKNGCLKTTMLNQSEAENITHCPFCNVKLPI